MYHLGQFFQHQLEIAYREIHPFSGRFAYFQFPDFLRFLKKRSFPITFSYFLNLETFFLEKTEIKSESMAFLALFPKLKHLNVSKNAIGDRGIEVFFEFLNEDLRLHLESLTLIDTGINPSAIDSENLPALKHLIGDLSTTEPHTESCMIFSNLLPHDF